MSKGGGVTVLMRNHVDLQQLLLLLVIAATITLTRSQVDGQTKAAQTFSLQEQLIDIPVVKVTSQEETAKLVSIIHCFLGYHWCGGRCRKFSTMDM